MHERIGVLPAYQLPVDAGVASEGKIIVDGKIRAVQLTRHWPEAELFTIGRHYSAVIFQRAYWLEYARAFQGVKILDIADPDFLHWNSSCLAMADLCDFVVTSNQELAEMLSRHTRTAIRCIPDRMDVQSICREGKEHSGNGPAKTVVWHGCSSEFASLDAVIPDLLRYGIDHFIVICIGTARYQLPARFAGKLRINNYSWEPETVHGHLLEADIVLDYRPDRGRENGQPNSNTVLAWALRLPVAHCARDLQALIPEAARVREAADRYAHVTTQCDVRQSVEDYRSLIQSFTTKGARA